MQMSPTDNPGRVSSPARLGLELAAAHLGISPWTLRLWTRKRRVACFRVAGKLSYSIEELDRIIRESEQPRAEILAAVGQ